MELRKFHFYQLRLRNASLPELIYRAKHFFFIKKLKIQISKKKNPVAIPRIDFKNIKDLQLPTFHGEASKRLVQKILNGELFTLNYDLTAIKKIEDTWRNTYFDDIKLSDQDPDIRSVWEPARLQHIAILIKHIIQIIQNDNLEFSDDVKNFTKSAILQWIYENPFLYGPHYISAMECGLRIPLLFYCLKVLENLKASEFRLILDTIYRHAWWVSNRLSLYSSRGNHTVAEAVGLVFGGAVFRNTTEGRGWLKKGYELLKKELDHQILDDGGPAEQSLNYHRFVLDLFWFAIDFLERNNLQECIEFKERLVKAENFIAVFKDYHGRLLSIGDSDGGYAIAPGIYPRRMYPKNQSDNIQVFSNTGYTIIRDEEAFLTFDHGPLGMAPFYNHGHADALSINLSVCGQAVLVDPGTYRYNGKPQFREYFKSTRAHNTITIDGQDQAIQESGFIWSHPYNAELIHKENQRGMRLIKATHDGYLRYKKPVRHIRSLFIFEGTKIIIEDQFSGEGIHDFELNFHLHPDMKVSKSQNNWWNIHNGAAEIYITNFDQNEFQVIKGKRDPIFGWFSHSYGLKCETSVLNTSISGAPEEMSFKTGIGVYNPFDLQDIIERIDEIERAVEHPGFMGRSGRSA